MGSGLLQERINEIWDSLIDKWLLKNTNPKSKYLLNTCIGQAVEQMRREFPKNTPIDFPVGGINEHIILALQKANQQQEWFEKWFGADET